MPRLPRYEIAGAGTFHVITRGNNQSWIFHDENDFEAYLEVVAHSKALFDYQLFHYELMSNHVHLMINVKCCEDLSQIMKAINQGYALIHKRRYGNSGHLWQNRFKSYAITSDAYSETCGIYIELNSVRAGIVDQPEKYQWGSYRTYALGEKDPLVDLDPVYLGSAANPEARMQAYREKTKMWLKRGVKKIEMRKMFKNW